MKQPRGTVTSPRQRGADDHSKISCTHRCSAGMNVRWFILNSNVTWNYHELFFKLNIVFDVCLGASVNMIKYVYLYIEVYASPPFLIYRFTQFVGVYQNMNQLTYLMTQSFLPAPLSLAGRHGNAETTTPWPAETGTAAGQCCCASVEAQPICSMMLILWHSYPRLGES